MSEQQHKALEPCPFCGSSDVRNVSSNFAGPSNHLHSGDKLFAVNCGDCGASVPNRYRNDLVISAWNRRPAAAELRRLHAENEALRKDAKDAALFRWWFSETPKGEFVVTYLEGLRDKWGLDRWRAAIDAARRAGGAE